jgi:hypothetical protein
MARQRLIRINIISPRHPFHVVYYPPQKQQMESHQLRRIVISRLTSTLNSAAAFSTASDGLSGRVGFKQTTSKLHRAANREIGGRLPFSRLRDFQRHTSLDAMSARQRKRYPSKPRRALPRAYPTTVAGIFFACGPGGGHRPDRRPVHRARARAQARAATPACHLRGTTYDRSLKEARAKDRPFKGITGLEEPDHAQRR